MAELGTMKLEDVLSWVPCEDYPADRLRGLAVGLPERATPLEVLDHLRGEIPDEDLAWLMCEALARLDPVRLRWWACDCAERALDLHGGEVDPRPRAAIGVARRYARGEATGADLAAAEDAARAAARAAAWAAARAAAWDAARAAAWAAARAAAWDAARDAARAAAWAAARAAAGDAAAGADERAWQIGRLREVLRG